MTIVFPRPRGIQPSPLERKFAESLSQRELSSIAFSSTTVGSTAGVETTLHSTTIPPNILTANGEYLEIENYISLNNTAGPSNTTWKFYVDATAVTLYDSATAPFGSNPILKARVTKTGSNTVLIGATAVGNGISNSSFQSATVTLTSSFVIKVTGKGPSGNDAQSKLWRVEWHAAPNIPS